MITDTIRQELTRLEAGMYGATLHDDGTHEPCSPAEAAQRTSRYFALLVESGAPIKVRATADAGVTETTQLPGFVEWWAENFPGAEPYGLYQEWMVQGLAERHHMTVEQVRARVRGVQS